MSESSAKLRKGANKNQKRNLPSWMSSSEHGSKSHGKKSTDAANDDEKEKTEETKQAKGHDKAVGGGSPSNKTEHSKKSAASSSSTANFSKLLEGVVFVLSGFVNPERSMLRSQAIEMGAAYQADWNSDCTLLVCAFPNTPKFRQVEADCGTIISKEWIIECYNQKKLVDIEKFLMHTGKPWRKGNISHKTGEEENPSKKSQKVEKGSKLMPTTSSSSKQNKTSNPGKERFSPSELKRWAADDLNKTILWLESQEEKPEESEIKQIAAEGILICMQDAIDSIEQKQGVQHIMEQWQCIPRVVQELAKLEGKGSAALSNGDLCSQAKAWKQIYEEELQRLDSDSVSKKQKQKTNESESERSNNGRSTATRSDAAGYDSDETIEMTEEEIELAYKNVTS
ncbi:DNA-repair protein XRCC1 isoform X1 [Pistacia vera]|uniref:DNA-repair protein XRCC1 isoform X1 n=1 Tax=Pistacia vera TaxID=55513 RepID=UPI001263DB95|nr:DNA-repair protein XRCC1 isoform X1 [Pistacia vera]XP_031262189.1 DNA-repair protein XRCC1 isoform X1 [Pistacia vera]